MYPRAMDTGGSHRTAAGGREALAASLTTGDATCESTRIGLTTSSDSRRVERALRYLEWAPFSNMPGFNKVKFSLCAVLLSMTTACESPPQTQGPFTHSLPKIRIARDG